MELKDKVSSKVDKTIKYVFKLNDGAIIEVTYIDNGTDKDIICVASQTMCNMKCSFCHLTDHIGNIKLRDVTSAEINETVDIIYKDLSLDKNERRLHISFMGCGEPLANLSEVEKSMRDCAAMFTDLDAHVSTISYPEARIAQSIRSSISSIEACVIHRKRLETMVEQMDPIVGPRMLLDLNRPATEYAAALRQMHALRRTQATGSLRDIDILLVPTIQSPAIPVAAFEESLETYIELSKRYSDNTATGNVLGLCGLSLPCGVSTKGLPIGLMIYAKPFAEDIALRAGYAYEQATEWRLQHPDLGWAS